jgi:hypothetical protein
LAVNQGLLYNPSFGYFIYAAVASGSTNYSAIQVLPNASGGIAAYAAQTPVGSSQGWNSIATQNANINYLYMLYQYSTGSGVKPYIYRTSSSSSGNIYVGNTAGVVLKSMVMDPTDSFLYITNQSGNEIWKCTVDGTMTSFVSVTSPNGIAIDLVSSNIYVGTNGSNVVKITPAGTVTNYSAGTFTSPSALAYDTRTGMLAVGDSSTGTVYAVSPSGSSVTIATGVGTLAGLAAYNGDFYIYDASVGLKKITVTY